jgi:hypothetical protein
MRIYANKRKDGTRLFLGKQDYGFIYGNSETGKFFFAHKLNEYMKKHSENKPTHSMIVEDVKAKRLLEALPFIYTKHTMDEVFKLAEDM